MRLQMRQRPRMPSWTARIAGLSRQRPALRAAVVAHAPAGAVVLAVCVSLFLGLGAAPLFDVDEGAFSEATREMLARGDYVSTWLDGQPRYDKPILVYWLQAASVSLFGAVEIGFRLSSALAATAWIAAIGAFTRGAADRASGHAAAFIAATTAGVSVIGRAATADALLNLLLALAMFDIMRYAGTGAGREAPLLRRRAFLWIALGALTKGPVALLIPAAASCLGFALQGRIAAWWRAVRDPVGWLILLAVAAPWYLLETARRGEGFIDGFFLHHNVERYMAPLQGHGGGMLYYVPALLLILLPWSGLFLAVLVGAPVLRTGHAARAAPDAFLWSWFLFVFVFFSLGATKLPHYLLYGATPLFILMARGRGVIQAGVSGGAARADQNVNRRSTALAFAPPLLLLAAVAAMPHLLARAAPAIGNAYLREALGRSEVFGPAWQGAAWLLLAAGIVCAVWRGAASWPRLAAICLLCGAALAALLLPALGDLQQGPVKEAAQLARRAGWTVQRWRIDAPSFSVYRQAPTPAAPPALPAAMRGQVILTRSDALAAPGRPAALDGARILYRKGGIVLLRLRE